MPTGRYDVSSQQLHINNRALVQLHVRSYDSLISCRDIETTLPFSSCVCVSKLIRTFVLRQFECRVTFDHKLYATFSTHVTHHARTQQLHHPFIHAAGS